MKKITALIMLVLFYLLITFPAVNREFELIHVRDLDGAFYPLPEPELTARAWFSGTYQKAFVPWLEENIGFRPLFVRIYNQFRYSVYREATSDVSFIGRQRVLFQKEYYTTYRGGDAVGIENARSGVRKMKYVQDRLQENGIGFLYVMAPGKVSVYADYLPPYMVPIPCDTSNNRLVAPECIRQGVNHIDFVPWFRSLRDTVPYPLFPKGGVHWSGYGTAIAADTIFSALETVSGRDLVDFSFLPGHETDRDFKWTDNDIEKSFNLLFPTKAWTLYYPGVRFETGSEKTRWKILLVGDSFTQSFFFFNDYFRNLFSVDSRFWPGFEQNIWYDANGETLFYEYVKDKSHVLDEVLDYDFVMILTTEINTGSFGFGFVDHLYGEMKERSHRETGLKDPSGAR